MITKTKNNYDRFICDAKDITFFSANLYKIGLSFESPIVLSE